MSKPQTFTPKGTFIWLICAVFFLYEFLLRTVVGTFQHPIMYDLELSALEFSVISSTAYLLIYAIMQIPVGMILDRIGLKKSLFVGAIVCALASLGFATAQSYSGAVVFRLLTGFGSSFGFICLLVAIYDWLPRSRVALLIGVSQFIGTMGPMLAAGPLEVLASNGDASWRSVFYGLSLFGLILSVFILIFVENNQETTGDFTILKRPESISKTLRTLFSQPQAWAIAGFAAFVYFSLEYLSENEGKIFLVAKGLTPTFAAFMITVAWFGYAIGCPLIGWLSDYFKRRKPLMVLAAVSCTLGILGVIFCTSEYLVAGSFLLLGFGAAGQSISYATIAEQFQKTYLAAGLSLNNATIMLFSAVNAPIMSTVIDTIKADEIPSYADYQLAFLGLALFVGLSVVIAALFVRETYCKSQVSFTILNRT